MHESEESAPIGGAGESSEEVLMFLIREVMYCKPGQVKPMVQKLQTLAKIAKNLGMGSMRVMTDSAAERFWTVVMEVEAESLDQFEETSRRAMENKELQEAMKGYHDLVDYGRREIYRIEG